MSPLNEAKQLMLSQNSMKASLVALEDHQSQHICLQLSLIFQLASSEHQLWHLTSSIFYQLLVVSFTVLGRSVENLIIAISLKRTILLILITGR